MNWTRDIVVELAEELKLHPRIALLYSEQDKRVLKEKNAQEQDSGVTSDESDDRRADRFMRSHRRVMGAEPFVAALRPAPISYLADELRTQR